MIDKRVASIAEALHDVADGATVLLGGFGSVGQPNALIDGLIEQGARDLTVVANNAGHRPGRARAADGARPRAPDHLQLSPQQQFDRLRGAATAPARSSSRSCRRARSPSACAPPAPASARFFTPTGVGTKLAQGKETREIGGAHAGAGIRAATATSRWSRRGAAIAGATSPIGRAAATSIR